VKIAVCVKEVPDTTAEKRIDPGTGRLVRDEGDRMLNEFDKYAVEEAVRLKEAGAADEVILISLGPEKAVESLRQGLAMGADRLVLVSDPAAAGSDYLGTAAALSKVLEETGAELALLGSEATDARSGVMAAVNGGSITVERQSDDGVDTVEAPLPAVVSVTKAINEPRYPSLKGIMGAKKKPQDVTSLAEAGIDAAAVGEQGARTKVVGVETPPARTAGQVVKDEGNGAQQILDFLIEKKIV